ncbi:MAG: cyanophycin synthetase [Patescibacteria group bacterium]
MASRDYFKGKRIAVIGLGIHGEMVEDVKYLIKAGAWVSIYDLKSEARLKNHLIFLRSIGLANYVCGSIPAEDLLDMDMIILSHEYPRDSSFLKEVYGNNQASNISDQLSTEKSESEIKVVDKERNKVIVVEYPETLFFRLAPPITLIGVIGCCGKSTVISILGPILEKVCKEYETQDLFILDPESSDGILAHLRKVKSGDIVLMRIVDLILPELNTLRISPHVAIFTSIPSKNSYISSPFEILAYQTYNNYIVASDEIIDATRAMKFQPKAKMLRTKSSLIPADWGFSGSGIHDRSNAALALQTAQIFKADEDTARNVFSKWRSLKGRLELVKKVKGIEFYNDTMSITPDATLVGIMALSKDRNIVLIFGGADVGHDYRTLYIELPRYVHTLINIPGSGTLRQRAILQEVGGLTIYSAPNIEEAVRSALDHAKKGDRVLFSPGFGAGGADGSKIERGERFVRAVRGI